MMKKYCVLTVLMLAGCAAAQIATSQIGAPMSAVNSGGVSGGVAQNIPGHPFSADIFVESTRTLANGEVLQVNVQGKLYRDSAGRIRRESKFQGQPVRGASNVNSLVITDPVQHVMIILDQTKKTALVLPYQSPPAKVIAGQPGSGPASSNVGATVASPPAVALTQASASAVRVNVEPLATRELDGLSLTGTRTTRLTPAGAAGNEKPIVSTTEIWTSPELKVTILSETNDPRSGKATTKLVNVLRTEPDASLFLVPPDYAVTDKTKK